MSNGGPLKVLIVTSEPPTILKVRVFRFARLLSSAHQVHVVSVKGLRGGHATPEIKAASERELRECGVALTSLEANWAVEGPNALSDYVRGMPWRVARYTSRGLRLRMRAVLERIRPDLIHVDRIRSCPLVAGWTGPMYVDMTDPIGWYFEQRAAADPWPSRLFLAAEARRMWRYEISVAQAGIPLLFASEFGAQRFLDRCRNACASVVPVPLPATPLDDPAPAALPGTRPAICFEGTLYYPPNVRAIDWFCRKCWPLVRAKLPSASLHIVGSHPSRTVRRLPSLEGVYLHADPVKMDHLLRGCDMAIAPLLLCAGYPNKIVDSAILGGVPVIASPAARAGLPEPVREHVLSAATPSEWVEQIAWLWSEPAVGAQRGARLAEAIQAHLGNNLVQARLASVIERACGSAQVHAQPHLLAGRELSPRECDPPVVE